MPDSPRVLGIGELLWDISPEGKHLGGAPGNFAYHVQQQGISAAPVSAVGDDDLGRELLETLRGRDVSTDFIATLENKPTSTVDVELDDGKPTYTIHENVAWDAIPKSDALLVAAREADAICYGTLAQRAPTSRATIQATLKAVKPTCMTVFDVNLRQSFYNADVVRAGLEHATAFKLSDEEVPEVAKLLELPAGDDAFAKALFDAFHRLTLLIVTRGGDGSTVTRRDGESSTLPVERGTVVSTVGAGDSFTAGLVASLLKGRPLREAHERATKLASHVVASPGAMPEVPENLRK